MSNYHRWTTHQSPGPRPGPGPVLPAMVFPRLVLHSRRVYITFSFAAQQGMVFVVLSQNYILTHIILAQIHKSAEIICQGVSEVNSEPVPVTMSS